MACPSLPTAAVAASSIIQFNDNGGYCWYQDERAVVDTKANKLVIGTTASGGSRNGQNEAVVYDLATNKGTRFTLPSSLATSNVDDHNSPALLIRPDGKYLAQWSGHRVDCLSRFSIFDGTAWGAETEGRLDAVRLPVGRRQHEHGHLFESLVHRNQHLQHGSLGRDRSGRPHLHQ